MNSSRMCSECATLTAKQTVLPPLAVLVPVGDDVADQVGAVHALGELRFDVIADAGLDAAQVRIDRRKDASSDQILLLDQLGDLRAFDDHVEDAAEPAAVTAAWRGCQAEQHRVGIVVDDLAVGFGRAMMASSMMSKSAGGSGMRLRPHGARPQRLNRRDLHRLVRSAHEAGLDDAVLDAVGG